MEVVFMRKMKAIQSQIGVFNINTDQVMVKYNVSLEILTEDIKTKGLRYFKIKNITWFQEDQISRLYALKVIEVPETEIIEGKIEYV